MPKVTPISPPLEQALIQCFRATTRLVRPELRRQLVLVGGAASIAHNSIFYTEDVDVAAPSNVIHDICNIIEIGDAIERIHVTEPFFEGSVASMSDLLRLRAVTVVDRGSDGEIRDFQWLLSEVARAGQLLPGLNQEELEYMVQAGWSCLGRVESLLLYSILKE